jgi:hypothetical protein
MQAVVVESGAEAKHAHGKALIEISTCRHLDQSYVSLKVLYYSWWHRSVDNSSLFRYWLVLRQALAASCTLVHGLILTNWSAEEVTKFISSLLALGTKVSVLSGHSPMSAVQ